MTRAEKKQFDSKLKDELAEVNKNPRHQNDKTQVKAAGGVSFAGLLGCAGAESIELLGENVTEIVGGGTGVAIIFFFIFKFFSIELEEMSSV